MSRASPNSVERLPFPGVTIAAAGAGYLRFRRARFGR